MGFVAERAGDGVAILNRLLESPCISSLRPGQCFNDRQGGREGGREGGRAAVGGHGCDSPEATRKDTAKAEKIKRPMLRTSL
jgi:hypothetical protein